MTRIHTITAAQLLTFAIAAALLALAVALVSLAVLDAMGADEFLGPRLRRGSTLAAEDMRLLVAGRFSP